VRPSDTAVMSLLASMEALTPDTVRITHRFDDGHGMLMLFGNDEPFTIVPWIVLEEHVTRDDFDELAMRLLLESYQPWARMMGLALQGGDS